MKLLKRLNSTLFCQRYAFVGVETLVKSNDSQVVSQIYRIALAYDDSKVKEKKEEVRRKKEDCEICCENRLMLERVLV